MALVVTPGAADADSYLDVSDADSRAAAELGTFAATWTASSDSGRKEAALRRATRDVDKVVEAVAQRWDDLTPQALLFPRSIDLNSSSVPYIVEAVKRATLVQALFLFANADVLDNAASRRARGMTNFSETQGTSGSMANDASFGRLSPELEMELKPVMGSAVMGRIVLY